MRSKSQHGRVVHQSLEDEIERLETYVRRMEQRYERSPAFAEIEVTSGNLKETADVSRWLMSYRALMRLREATARGAATGSLTTSTG